jgi:5'(3')-deoxyribonucleotidase
VGLRLGIDLDGVVADFNRGWMRAYNEQFGTDLRTEQVQMWDGLYTLTHFEDMTQFWDWARDHGGHSVFRHLEPYPDAIDTIRSLNREGHDIVILTAKPDWAIHDTMEWLADHRVPTREIHFLEDKWAVDCDLYLDDSPHTVRGYVENGRAGKVCRFVRPWNSPVDGARDVHSWREYHEVVGGTADAFTGP